MLQMVMIPRSRIVEQLLNHIESIQLIDTYFQNPPTTDGLTVEEINKLEEHNARTISERKWLTDEVQRLGNFLKQHDGKDFIESDFHYATDMGWLDNS